MRKSSTRCVKCETPRRIAEVAVSLVPIVDGYDIGGTEGSQRTLFSEPSQFDAAAEWPAIFQALWRNAEALGLSKHTSGSEQRIAWQDGTGDEYQVVADGPEKALGLLMPLACRFRECEQRSYDRLATFKPNIGEPPLPAPYRIDLTHPSPTLSRKMTPSR